jgi:hypothetical protein
MGFAYLIRKHPRAVRVDIFLGPLFKPFRRIYSRTTGIPGLRFTHYRNVLVWWHRGDGAAVSAALHRLQ